ncbi:hypothetical protein V5O48_011451 [Marasmius crinis-equi]|uniref:Uncharacterized protein n=1 Tax=Marasmius crinis-equi TaxID=585013 RepID=A0ABR3F5W6_9AGAR
MFNKRVKSKPTQRARATSPEQPEDNDTTSVTAEESPSTIVKKFKDKSKRNKPKSRLSFGGDADEEEDSGETFQVKKSKLSRKVNLGTHPSNLDQATISPSRPTYDQAYLNELKASTPSSRAPPVTTDPYDADMSMVDVVDVSMDVFETETSETSIPAESSIKAAKERRERLRTTLATGTDDYISLSVTKSVDHGPHPESRLVREEDELGEADDEFAEYTGAQDRIGLSNKSRKLQANKRRGEIQEMIADADEQDEETAEWEQEQLRRGGHLRRDAASPKAAKQTYKPAPIPPVTAIPTLSQSIAWLTQQMSALTTSHSRNTTALTSLAQERDQVDAREKEMRELIGKAEEKRAWFDAFREWVEGVAGFLDEKYPMLEKLEEEHVSLLQERFDMVNKRRRQDDDDDLSTFLGPLPIENKVPVTSEETDELGRAIPKPDPTTQKRQRRADRLARYQSQRTEAEEEGFATDSDLPLQDEEAYQNAIQSVMKRTKDVLADVKAKEFLDPGKGQWTAWREKYADSYFGAWGGLGVVSVWEFWARLEAVGWDPIAEPKSLDSFRWYQGLHDYCRPGDPADESREIGQDGDLVSSMVTTAIVPRISKLIEGGAFDAYSRKHIRRMIDLLEEIEATVEQGSPRLQILPKSVVSCFDKAISESEAQLLRYTSTAGARPAPSFDPESVPSRQRFSTRQLKLLSNLLKWRKATGERFGIGQLVTRLVDGIIVVVADSGWEVGGADVVQTVSGMLPPDLITQGIRSRVSR